MLNSVEHEILNAYKYKNFKKFCFFQAQISLECYFSCSSILKCQQLLAFKTFMSRKISCSVELSMRKDLSQGPDLLSCSACCALDSPSLGQRYNPGFHNSSLDFLDYGICTILFISSQLVIINVMEGL